MIQVDKEKIIVGKIGAPYGVHGWLKILAYTEFGPHIFEYQPWHIEQENQTPRDIHVESFRPHGKGLIAKLADIHTPEEARLLTGATITIHRSQLPQLNENEYYWSDLVGLTLINQAGVALGKVIYLIETGSNDVLVIKGEDGKEHAIPYLLGKVVTHIDLLKQEIHVDWELI